jgi:hypothetical protein
MDFQIPADLPVISEEERREQEVAAENVVRAQRRSLYMVDETVAKQYFTDNDVVTMLNSMLTSVFLAQPEDPIDFMTKWLLRRDVDDVETNEEGQMEELSKKHHDAVKYCQRFKLPQLFDELLRALLEAMPEDQARFATSWLRWNKKKFVEQYQPPGYQEYIDNMDK